MTSLIYNHKITKINPTCFFGCSGEVNVGAGIPSRNIPIEGKVSSRRVWATLRNRDKQFTCILQWCNVDRKCHESWGEVWLFTDMNSKNNALWNVTLPSQHGNLLVFQQTVIFLDNIVM